MIDLDPLNGQRYVEEGKVFMHTFIYVFVHTKDGFSKLSESFIPEMHVFFREKWRHYFCYFRGQVHMVFQWD